MKETTSAYILFRHRRFVEQTCACSNEEDVFNDTCNSVPYCSIAIESSNKE